MNLDMFRGNSRVFDITVTRKTTAGMRPVDLSGASVRFVARKLSDDDAEILVNKSVGNGVTVTDATNGYLSVTFAPADTKNLYAPQALHYDVEVTESDGTVSTPVQGILMLRRTLVPA